MRREMYILLVVGIGLLVFASTIRAQDEQWLQYKCEREAERIIGYADMRSSNLELSPVKPPDVKLPQFKTEKPLFAKWTTPMVKSGFLWVALDRTSESGKYDRLFIDSNGNGHLDDEEAQVPYQTDQYSARFGPVKVVFEAEDGPVSYHLNLRLFDYGDLNRQRLYVNSGGWYEGEVTVADKKRHCVLLDQNANGTFDDKALDPAKSDRIRIGEKGEIDGRFVGRYVDIDGVLYRLEVAHDGAFVKLAKAEGVKYGSVRVPETITEFSAGGPNGLFKFKPDKGTGSLPVGRYRVNSWTIDRKDEKGKLWQLRGTFFSIKGNFEVTKDAETALEIGEPVTGTISAMQNGDNYEFSKGLKGPLGEYVMLTSSGQEVRNLWKMKAANKDGTYEKIYPIPDQ